jgi:hypothetical protein
MRMCAECGKENSDSSRFCFCGNDLTRPAPPAQRGVGGPLLFFCVQMVILGPLLAVSSFGPALRGVRAIAPFDTRVALVLLLQLSLSLTVTALGVFTGLQLWRVRPGALRLTRAYLLALGALPLVTIGLPLALGVQADMDQRIVLLQNMTAASGVLSAVFWWIYFSSSRRVRATYEA